MEYNDKYFDGEHTYRDYFAAHADECVDWCTPYIADGGYAMAVNDVEMNELSGLMIAGEDIDTCDTREDAEPVKRLAKAVNADYDLYSGWSDTHIAIEAMRKVGCASCPWFKDCAQMDEILGLGAVLHQEPERHRQAGGA